MELNFIEDIAKKYSANRKGVSEEEALEFINIMFKYIRERIESNETYAIQIPNIGVLHRKLNYDSIRDLERTLTKEDILNEKLFVNSLFKRLPKIYFKYEDREAIKNHTNNHSIKN